MEKQEMKRNSKEWEGRQMVFSLRTVVLLPAYGRDNCTTLLLKVPLVYFYHLMCFWGALLRLKKIKEGKYKADKEDVNV